MDFLQAISCHFTVESLWYILDEANLAYKRVVMLHYIDTTRDQSSEYAKIIC